MLDYGRNYEKVDNFFNQKLTPSLGHSLCLPKTANQKIATANGLSN